MRRRIIIEGADGTGKTTLLMKLKREFGDALYGPIVNGEEDKRDFNTWWPMVFEAKYFGPVPIHDRFFYSELVYGPVIRGNIKVSGEVLLSTLDELRDNAFLIYASCPPAVIERNLAETRHQMAGVRERWGELVKAYAEVMQVERVHYPGRFYRYDFTKTGEPEAVIKTVRRYLDGEL